MSIEENKKVVLRFNRQFLEGCNTAILKKIEAGDFTNHTAAGDFPSDVNGLIQFVGMLHKAFPDISFETHEQFGEGDLVATRKTITDTHLGEIMGHSPTGKKVTMNVIDIVRIKNGQYLDHWRRNDIIQVIQQL